MFNKSKTGFFRPLLTKNVNKYNVNKIHNTGSTVDMAKYYKFSG